MKVGYQVTAGHRGISVGRVAMTGEALIGNFGFEQYELPAADVDGNVTIADVEALIREKGYKLVSMWRHNELDGDSYMQADVEKIEEV